MKEISFQVSDEVAARMKRESVYLDVFGFVRWLNVEFGAPVDGASGWEVRDA